MASIKPLQKTSTDAPMFKYKPTSPGRRHRLIVNKKGLWKGRPHQKLTFRIKSHAGRNNTGQITIRVDAPRSGFNTGSSPIVRYTLQWNEGLGGLLKNSRTGDVRQSLQLI